MNDSEKLDRVIEKMGEVAIHLARVDERLGKYNSSLDFHIKRTELAEARIEQAEKALGERLKPVERHVNGVNTILKAIGFLLTVAAVAAAIYRATH